jgi:hypothetical protein
MTFSLKPLTKVMELAYDFLVKFSNEENDYEEFSFTKQKFTEFFAVQEENKIFETLANKKLTNLIDVTELFRLTPYKDVCEYLICHERTNINVHILYNTLQNNMHINNNHVKFLMIQDLHEIYPDYYLEITVNFNSYNLLQCGTQLPWIYCVSQSQDNLEIFKEKILVYTPEKYRQYLIVKVRHVTYPFEHIRSSQYPESGLVLDHFYSVGIINSWGPNEKVSLTNFSQEKWLEISKIPIEG